jgi:hypothetical protein
MTPQHVDAALAAATSLYAIALDGLQQRWRKEMEPDWTWVEVALGTALTLGAAALRTRVRPVTATWEEAEADTWRSFFLSGSIIIAWQLARMAGRRFETQHYVQHERSEHTNGRHPEATTALAQRGRVGAQ